MTAFTLTAEWVGLLAFLLLWGIGVFGPQAWREWKRREDDEG